MFANYLPTGAEYFRLLPEMILTAAGTLIMVLEPLTGYRRKRFLGHLALAGLLAALWAAVVAYSSPGPAFNRLIVVDGFATFFRVLVIVVGILTVLSCWDFLARHKAESGEFYSLILFSVVGQCVMVSANELITLFIGLEVSSIATYVLAGYLRDDKRANEAALKYFLLGSFATAFLLYGVAWIYGVTGTTNLVDIRQILESRDVIHPILAVSTAAALMFVGFAFKVSAAPFQIWAPDVYQGAPTPVVAFMSAGPKAAGFAILLRVYLTAFGPIDQSWVPFVWTCALATMVIGNFAALAQNNVKRLLAYSSIAHAGYIMVAVATGTAPGAAAAMFYLAAYAFMNVGAFVVVSHISGRGERKVNIDDLAGLSSRQPLTAALFSVFLLSLIGVPLTGGFFGKFYIFKAAIDSQLYWLTILGLLTSAVAAYYYLRLIVVMYMRPAVDGEEELPPLGGGLKTALWASALGTLALGIFPSAVLNFAGASGAMLVR